MYHTPGGTRILTGAERKLYTHSLAMVVDLLSDCGVECGIAAFDELQRNQKLFVLYQSARALLQPDEPAPELTASIEASVAIVYEHAETQVFQEIDDSVDVVATSFWRKLVLEAAQEQLELDELPAEISCDTGIWSLLIECLSGCVLWDNDYECLETLDLPPEESRHLRAMLGVSDGYHTDVPPDPPDEQANLYLDALTGLTASVRRY